MLYLVLCIVVLVGIVIVFSYFSKDKNTGKQEEEINEVPADCCGAHEVCEADLKKLSEKIEYFDDEDLDQYKEKGELEYEDNEIEEFRDVLYTLNKEEISDWLHSLELRKIFVPVELKSEVIALLSE